MVTPEEPQQADDFTKTLPAYPFSTRFAPGVIPHTSGANVPACMARPRVARQTSETTNVRCCINVLGLACGAVAPGQHGYPRASKTELRDRPQPTIMAPCLMVAPGRPFVHLVIPSRRPRWEAVEPTDPQISLSTFIEVTQSHPLGATVARLPDPIGLASDGGGEGWRPSSW